MPVPCPPLRAPHFVAGTEQVPYPWRVFRRFLVAAVFVLALASSATAVPAVAKTNKAVLTHKLIVAVKKNVAPAVEKKLAMLVLVSQNGGPPAGAVATPSKPLT